ERCQLCEFRDRPLDIWGDLHRGGVPVAAVDNAMSYSVKVFKSVQSCRGASLQIIEDANDGISMFFQLQLLVDFLLACAAENELCRFSCPIDAALGQQQLAFSLEEAEGEANGDSVTNQNLCFCLRHDRSLVFGVCVSSGRVSDDNGVTVHDYFMI